MAYTCYRNTLEPLPNELLGQESPDPHTCGVTCLALPTCYRYHSLAAKPCTFRCGSLKTPNGSIGNNYTSLQRGGCPRAPPFDLLSLTPPSHSYKFLVHRAWMNARPSQREVKSPANFEGRYRPYFLSNLEILCSTLDINFPTGSSITPIE